MKLKDILAMYIAIVGLMAISAYGGYVIGERAQDAADARDTVRVVVTDTIAYYEPVARDSVVVRYVTRRLGIAPAADAAGTAASGRKGVDGCGDDTAISGDNGRKGVDGWRDGAEESRDTESGDSIDVVLPISQKKYETEEYRAYVSGFEPRLDSIFVYQRTVTERVAAKPHCTGQPRFGVGVVTGIGYCVINKRPDAFVGVGLSYRIW